MSGYPYAEADPRQSAATYMYPPFDPELPAAHRESRERLLCAGNTPAAAAAPPGTTLARLEAAWGGDAAADETLATFWRKLEAARVLRAAYGPDGRPADRAEAPIDAYAFLAALLARRSAAAETRLESLQALTALMKALDVVAWHVACDGGLGAAAWQAVRVAAETELELLDRLAAAAAPEVDAAAVPSARTLGVGTADGVGLLAANTGRARAYLDLLTGAGLAPERAVVLEVPAQTAAPAAPVATSLFDNVTPLARALERAGVPFRTVEAAALDDPAILEALGGLPPVVVVAGPPGAILPPPLFGLGRRFLHVHPGRLPAFRGSTPMYYQLLAEGGLTATALFLDERIDCGPIVGERDFTPPRDRREIDLGFDPWMRAVLLRDVVARIAAGETLPETPQPAEARPCYIIHPVLRHLAIDAGAKRRLER